MPTSIEANDALSSPVRLLACYRWGELRVNNYIPMDSKIKTILNVVVVIVVVIWLLQAFGVLGSLRDLRIR